MLRIELEKILFFNGEPVGGQVILTCSNDIILNDILMNLNIIENWSVDKGSNEKDSELKTQTLVTFKLSIGKLLNITTQLISLKSGTYNFPFQFSLPQNLQPSFEYPFNDKRAYIRYSLIGVIQSPYVQGSSSTFLIIKSRPSQQNSPLTLTATGNIHKWLGLIDSGSTVLRVNYPRTDYKVEEKIPLTVEIDNTKGEIKVIQTKIDIIRHVEFRRKSDNYRKYPMESKIIVQNFDTPVKSKEKKSFKFEILFKDPNVKYCNYLGILNPFPSIKNIAYLMPTTNGSIISCSYSLKATLYFSSYVSKSYRPRVIVPFWVVHQLQHEFDIEKLEQEQLKKALEESKIEAERKKMMENYAKFEGGFERGNVGNLEGSYENNDVNGCSNEGSFRKGSDDDNCFPAQSLVENSGKLDSDRNSIKYNNNNESNMNYNNNSNNNRNINYNNNNDYNNNNYNINYNNCSSDNNYNSYNNNNYSNYNLDSIKPYNIKDNRNNINIPQKLNDNDNAININNTFNDMICTNNLYSTNYTNFNGNGINNTYTTNNIYNNNITVNNTFNNRGQTSSFTQSSFNNKSNASTDINSRQFNNASSINMPVNNSQNNNYNCSAYLNSTTNSSNVNSTNPSNNGGSSNININSLYDINSIHTNNNNNSINNSATNSKINNFSGINDTLNYYSVNNSNFNHDVIKNNNVNNRKPSEEDDFSLF